MAIPLSSNFILNAQLPLDDRSVVADTTIRDTIATINRYDGLTVYIVSTNQTFQLQGGITNSDWVEIAGGSVEISEQVGNSIVELSDGIYSPSTIIDGVLTGGIVTWIEGYTYNISAAQYYIGGIYHSSPSINVTLDAADDTLDRIDVFYLDENDTAGVLTGDPSDPPASPSLEASQIQLGIALVTAATTEPVTPLPTLYVYRENVEWLAFTATPGTVAIASTVNPITDSVSVKFTNPQRNEYVRFTTNAFSPIPLYNSLVFNIRIDSGVWTSTSRIFIYLYNGTVFQGNKVIVSNGLYGFNIGNLGIQTVTIPLSNFGSISSITRVVIASYPDISQTLGFTLDNVMLQGAIVPATSGIQSVTGSAVDNTDPHNPVINLNGVQSVTGSGVDNSDPLNPIINSTGGGLGDLEEVLANGNSAINSIRLNYDGGGSPNSYLELHGGAGTGYSIPFLHLNEGDDGSNHEVVYYPGGIRFGVSTAMGVGGGNLQFPETLYSDIITLPLSISDGDTPIFADNTGNIDISSILTGGGGDSQDLQSVTDVGATTTNVITSTQGFLALSDGSISKSIGIINTTDGHAITMNEGGSASTPELAFALGFETSIHLKADNAVDSTTVQLPNADGILVLSVNGEVADTAGNITLDLSGGATPSLQTVTDAGYTTTNPIVSNIAIAAMDPTTGGGVQMIVDNEDHVGEGMINIVKSDTDSLNVRIRASNITAERELELPNGNGTLALSVNGEFADDEGNITIGTSGLTLQTNGIPNNNQSLLNLVAGSGITHDDDGSGNVTVQLGGELASDVNIVTSDSYKLILSGSNAYPLPIMQIDNFVDGFGIQASSVGGVALFGKSTDNTAIMGLSTNGNAIYGQADGAGDGVSGRSLNGFGGRFYSSSSNNSIQDVLGIIGNVPSDAEAGLGGAISFNLTAVGGGGETNVGKLYYQIDSDNNSTFGLSTTTGIGTPSVKLTINSAGLVTLVEGAPEYTDNATAVTAGLVVGTIYRTGDNLKIVH